MNASRRIARTLPTRGIALAFVSVAVLVLSACAQNPLQVVQVHQPLSARPQTSPGPAKSGGAIYSAATARPLFEDYRARRIGDTLTIVINEKINASKSASTKADREGSSTASLDEVKLGNLSVKGGSITGATKNGFNGGGDSASNNAFTGTIGVTVVEVLPNGNMLVSGEKQIGINQGSEFVRVSGVVDPMFIAPGNSISSTRVADARLEYRGTGYLDESQTMGWLQRAFLSVMPF